MATTTLNPSEISELIKARIEKVKLSAEARNEGVVTSVADGIVHEFESNLVWRASELLGVSTRDRVRLRKLVESRQSGAANRHD